MSLLSGVFFSQSVTVETFTGPGPTGPEYAPPVTVVGFYDDGLLAEQGSTGTVVEARSVFFCEPDEAALFVPESRFTNPFGDVSYVSQVRVRQASDLFANVEHCEVRLR